jgi:signal transduction histidine kinase
VRLDSIAREAADLASHRASDPSLVLEVSEALADIEVISDATMIKRAVLNLLLNAIDAVRDRPIAANGRKEPPRVHLGVKKQSPDQIAITVSDNGPGVPAELMDRIFNPFFTTKDRGMGLGLAIVHQIAESLHGNVQVANAPGGGAVFSLSIPVRWTATEND